MAVLADNRWVRRNPAQQLAALVSVLKMVLLKMVRRSWEMVQLEMV